MRCKHANSRFCGAGWRNNVFKLVKVEKKVEAYKPIYGESSIGCYKDKGNRDLPNLIRAGYGNPSKCFKLAMDGRYQYVGMQYRGECWAGNSMGKHGKRPDSECNMRCRHDNSRWCGAGWRNNIFKLVVKKIEYRCNGTFGDAKGGRQNGFCVTALGRDQNSGVKKLNNLDINTDERRLECLSLCEKVPNATGCEGI
jgi:hypothetical protein